MNSAARLVLAITPVVLVAQSLEAQAQRPQRMSMGGAA